MKRKYIVVVASVLVGFLIILWPLDVFTLIFLFMQILIL